MGEKLQETQKRRLLSLRMTSWQPASTAWNKTAFVCDGKKTTGNNTMTGYYKQGSGA